MSLQVIGPAGKGAKAVLWSETRMPRQTWSVDSQGRIRSQMFEDMILDVKGEAPALYRGCFPRDGCPKMGCLTWGAHLSSTIRSGVCPPQTFPLLCRRPKLRPGPCHRLGHG